MSFKDKAEDFLDGLIGKKTRKGLEQIGHAIMAGAPAFFVINWLPISDSVQAGLVFVLAIVGVPYVWGIAREITQNWKDDPDDTTLFTIGRLPVNGDMLVDIAAYSVGGAIAGVAAWII